MSYHTVLGYSENTIIDTYKEKYYLYLYSHVVNIFDDVLWMNEFKELPLTSRIDFLLHPDSSSLIQEVLISGSIESKNKFEQACKDLLAGNSKEMTLNMGKNIKSTDIKLTLQDNNPQKMQVGHPDHDQDGMLGWGDKKQDEWLSVFSSAFALLKDIDEEFFLEINNMIKKIVPMRTSIDVHNSCSYKECVGTLYLGYTVNGESPELNILEALIHESSHNKLNLIMQSEKLHINDYSLQYYSPYRPDARHVQGVLLGVHAIVPTVYVLLRGVEKGLISNKNWYEKVLLYHMKNKLGYRVLERHANFTAIGRKIYEDMGQVIKLCDVLIKNNVELQKIDFGLIQTHAKEHFIEVRNNYPHLQY